jgi:hypothetical protein
MAGPQFVLSEDRPLTVLDLSRRRWPSELSRTQFPHLCEATKALTPSQDVRVRQDRQM